MKNILTNCLLILVLLCLAGTLQAQQRLLARSKLHLVLDDGTDVVLYRAAKTRKWYYLPPPESIRVAKRENGDDEFLFIKFTTDDRVEDGGAQGGLLHFLVVWGLEQAQLEDLGRKLRAARTANDHVAGPVDLIPKADKSFALVSASLKDKELTKTLVTSGVAPVMAGGRAAIAARLDKNGAQLLEATMKQNRGASDFTVEFYYDYATVVKAASGKYQYDLNITHEQGDGMAYDLIAKELDNEPELYEAALARYEEKKAAAKDDGCGVADGMQDLMMGLQSMDEVVGNDYGGLEFGTSESMMRKLYDYFADTTVVTLEWSADIIDERVDAVRDAFFQMFLQDVTEPTLPEYMSLADQQTTTPQGGEAVRNGAQGGYHFKSCTELEATRSVSKSIILKNFQLPVKKDYPMVYNLPGGFPIRQVNLNDPFFQHRDINFIVDVEAMDIFEREVNYVSVNVRKKRSDGQDFADAVTISPTVMKDRGRLATITYARGEDRNPDNYEYKAQWSLRGGEVYPENPRWTKGDWQAVTLQAPIRPRTVEFEADLDELQEAGVTRATLQLRYLKYGRETETNIPLTVSRGTPLVESRIFTDREQRGYAYRFILNHKEEGKLATPWEAKINDDYVYATLPEELRAKDLTWLKKAKEAANIILRPEADGTIKPGAQILDKFKDILNSILPE